MTENKIVGLDIGTSVIRVAIGEIDPETQKMVITGTAQKKSAGLRNGVIVNIEDAKNAIKEAIDAAEQNADHMRQMHDKLQHDISELEERKSEIKAKVAAAKTQERMNDLTEKIGKTAGAGAAGKSAFDRMEKKADEMLDAANARAELNQSSAEEQSIEDLTKKYDSNGSESSVDDELAAMKAKLGL